MKKNRNGFFSEILSFRANVIELIFVAIFISLGVNLISNSFSPLIGVDSFVTLVIGIFFCLGGVLYFIARIFSHRVQFRNYQGFIIYHKKNNEIINVPRYQYSEDMHLHLNAAFFENEALKKIWNKESLENIYGVDADEEKGIRSLQLIRELTEYLVLQRLSIHLTDYFQDDKFKKENLREFNRNDIPDVLLKNRFLELFSKPMEDRPTFVDETFDDEDTKKGIVEAIYTKEAIYERFNLVLPKESIVRRINKNNIQIETKRCTINIEVCFDGIGAMIPFSYKNYYLDLHESDDVVEFQVVVEIKVYFKLLTFFSRTGWEYYQWVDSFLESLNEYISQQTFFENIGWNFAWTVIKYIDQKVFTREPEIQGEILFSDDFEDYILNTSPSEKWSLVNELGEIIVSDEIELPLNSTKCLKISSHQNTQTYLYCEFKESKKIKIDYDIRQEKYNNTGNGALFHVFHTPINIEKPIGSKNEAIHMSISNGRLYHFDTKHNYTFLITPNKWHHITLYVDCIKKKINYSVNGIEFEGNFRNDHDAVNAILTTPWKKVKKWTTYIDNVKIMQLE